MITSHAQEANSKQMENPLFICYECGQPVIAYDGRFFRTCAHDAPIVATPEAAKIVKPNTIP
jgi:hypothetical protein